MPPWTLYLALGLAFVAAIAVQMFVSVESTRRGDGLLRMWIKSGCLGGLTMIGVVAIFLLLANTVNWLGR